MKIGKLVQQPSGYQAFIPDKFPPKEKIVLSSKTQQLHAKAALMLGKLDGITQLLPDLDFFIFMYIRKEAARSMLLAKRRVNLEFRKTGLAEALQILLNLYRQHTPK